MAVRDIFKFSRKTFFDPTGWLDYESIKDQNRTIWTVLRGLFSVPVPERTETFEEACLRLNLSEEEIQATIANYHLFTLFFVLCSVISFSYTLFVLFHHRTLIGFILGVGATALFLSQAFRYDFWALQMHKRKLGLTFKDWKQHVLGIKGSST